MIDILAPLSASAAAGMRIGLPILVISLLGTDNLWSDVPIISSIKQPVLISILISWSLFELFASKRLLGQRLLQTVQLILSPIVGGLMALAVTKINNWPNPTFPVWLIVAVGATLALVIKLVEVGWFFRLRGIPAWVVFLEDILCICLVLFAFRAPKQGVLIAMLLLWLAIRSSSHWRDWYQEKRLQQKKDEK